MNNQGSNLVSFKNTSGTTTYRYVQAFQEISGVALWNPVASLVFCSSMLPILPTQTSKATVISNQQDNLTSNGNNNNLSNVLSDFEIAIEGSNQYRPIILCTSKRIQTRGPFRRLQPQQDQHTSFLERPLW
jgi:hypothetical protein